MSSDADMEYASDLASRLESARHPSRIFDAEIAKAIGWTDDIPLFTSSVDCAARTVQENMYWTVGCRQGRNVKSFATIDCGKAAIVKSYGYHPALALSAAVIKMLIKVNKLNKEKQ